MASVKNIYFQDDVMLKIGMVDNLSGLINDLLRTHFEVTGNKKEDLIKLHEKICERTKEIVDEQSNKLTLIEKQVSNIEQKEKQEIQTIQEVEVKKGNQLANIMNSAKEVYGVELTEEQAQEFVNGNCNCLYDYLVESHLIIEQQDNITNDILTHKGDFC
jgi:hypothetical protein